METEVNPQEKQGWWSRLRQGWVSLDDCAKETGRGRKRGRRVVCWFKRLYDAFGTHQCSLLACACAYCALLSLVPLLVVGISGLGFFMGGSTRAQQDVLQAINHYVPVKAGFIQGTLERILQDRGLIGFFGLVGLVYAAHQTFLAMQPAMNIIWGGQETRHWVRQRLTALGATFFALLLMGADLVVSTAFVYLQNLSSPYIPNSLETYLVRFGTGAIPLLLTTVLFTLLYRYLPARDVPWKAAAIGALAGGLLWQASKYIFTFSLVYIHTYDRLYGSVSSVIILVVWAYYSMAILLLGAEIGADYEYMRLSSQAAVTRSHVHADLSAAKGKEMPLQVTSPEAIAEVTAKGQEQTG